MRKKSQQRCQQSATIQASLAQDRHCRTQLLNSTSVRPRSKVQIQGAEVGAKMLRHQDDQASSYFNQQLHDKRFQPCSTFTYSCNASDTGKPIYSPPLLLR